MPLCIAQSGQQIATPLGVKYESAEFNGNPILSPEIFPWGHISDHRVTIGLRFLTTISFEETIDWCRVYYYTKWLEVRVWTPKSSVWSHKIPATKAASWGSCFSTDAIVIKLALSGSLSSKAGPGSSSSLGGILHQWHSHVLSLYMFCTRELSSQPRTHKHTPWVWTILPRPELRNLFDVSHVSQSMKR